jgi:hypothetical protein
VRLDPHSLPASFVASDSRADGGVRHVEVGRERVVLRRAVQGMRMAINLRIGDFLGIALREIDGVPALILKHRDPSLSIPLVADENGIGDIDTAWQMWADALALPRLDDTGTHAQKSASRRRRRSAIKWRRPSILMRRRTGGALAEMPVHRDEREIIARN